MLKLRLIPKCEKIDETPVNQATGMIGRAPGNIGSTPI
jgi:hypothetical protein